MSHGPQSAGDGSVEELDVACLALLSVGSGDVEVWEASVVFLIPLGALILLLLGLLGSELGELAAELAHLGHGVIVLVGVAEGGVAEADGNGAESGWVEGAWGVKDIEGALGGKGEKLLIEGLTTWGNWDGPDLPIFEIGDDGNGGFWEMDRKGGGLGRFH